MVLAQRLIDLLLFSVCALAAMSVGTAFTRRLAPFGISRWEAIMLALSSGLLIVAYGIFALGLLGGLHRTVLIVWLGVCYAVGMADLIGYLWRGRFPYPFMERWEDLSLTERLWLWLLIFLNLLALLLCFVPPWQVEWDSLSYHLAVPKIYWLEGRIRYIPFTHHAQFPMTTQMLYLLGLGLTKLQSAAVAKSFHWLFFVLCQLTLLNWATALPQKSLRAGIIGAIAFAALPIAFTEATTAYIDLALTAFSLLSLFALGRFAQQPDGRWLIWAGIFAGAAAGTKYTGLLCIGLLLALGFWAMRKVRAIRELPLRALLFSVFLAALIASPWYVKNLIWTGNPVFPFAFGGRHWTKEMSHTYTVSNREFGGGRDVLTLIATPLNLTLNEIRFGRCAKEWLGSCPKRGACQVQWKCGRFDNVDLPTLSVGVLPLVLLPTVLLVSIAGRNFPFVVAAPAIGMLVWFAWWFMEAQYLRYLLPALGWGCVLIGMAGTRWLQAGVFSMMGVQLTVTIGLVYALVVALWQAVPLLPVAVGLVPSEDFLRETTPVYRVAEFVNSALPRDAFIATYGEPLGYYFDRRYFWADSGHNRLIRYERLQGADDLLREWQRLGVTHVIINWRYVPKDSSIGRWIDEGEHQGKWEVLTQIGSEEVIAVQQRRRKP